ncbi:MAG: hypothetical protein AAGC85_01625 [Bacteroidota bacterium]
MSFFLPYLLLALLIWGLGYLHSGRFVQPRWKIPGKFFFYVSVSAVLAWYLGAYSLFFIILHPLIGLIFHIRTCEKNGIKWLSCEPREKYLALQEKWARGDFS